MMQVESALNCTGRPRGSQDCITRQLSRDRLICNTILCTLPAQVNGTKNSNHLRCKDSDSDSDIAIHGLFAAKMIR